MITKTSEKQLLRAIKNRLGLNDRQARSIIDENWFSMPSEPLRGVVVTVRGAYDVNPGLDIYLPANGGYYTWVGALRLKKDDLARWNIMSLEEAYSLPEDFRTLADSFKWINGKVTKAEPRDNLAIVVTVSDEDGMSQEMAMLADINDAAGLMSYAREKLGHMGRLCIEEDPSGERSLQSKGLPILEMICVDIDSNDLDEIYGEPAKLAA